MKLKNLRVIEKALSGNLTSREKRYLENLQTRDPELIRQLEDFEQIRRNVSGMHYNFSHGFADTVMNRIEQSKGIPVSILFADIIQRAFLRVAVTGIGILLVLVTLFSLYQKKEQDQYPVEIMLASESLLFDYYYYEMN